MSSKSTPAQTSNENLEKHSGTWYTTGSLPASFPKACHCNAAEYQLTGKGWVRAIIWCRRAGDDEKLSIAKGRAYPVRSSNNTTLKVQFFWPFRNHYHIIALAGEYWSAFVASGSKYHWVP